MTKRILIRPTTISKHTDIRLLSSWSETDWPRAVRVTLVVRTRLCIFLHLPLDIDLTVPRSPINYTVWTIVKCMPRTTKSARYSASLRLEKLGGYSNSRRTRKPLAHARSYTPRGRWFHARCLDIRSRRCTRLGSFSRSNPSFIQGPIHFDRRRMHQAARR